MKKLFNIIKRLLFVRGNVLLRNNTHIGFGSILWASTNLEVGPNVYIGKYCTIQCNGKIGNGVLIANNVGIVGRLDHDYRKVGSLMLDAPWIGTNSGLAQDPRSWINIEDDVWVGYGAILLSGITVGRGAVIAAGSVVIHDIEPYSIVSGNPATNIRKRFTPDQIALHESLIRAQSINA